MSVLPEHVCGLCLRSVHDFFGPFLGAVKFLEQFSPSSSEV